MIETGFTGAAVDRADNLRLDEAQLAELAAHDAALLMQLDGLDPVLDEEGRLTWLPLAGAAELIFLGLRGEVPLFAPLIRTAPGQRAWSVFGLLARMAAEEAALWGGAKSLIEWHNRHLFCGICGSTTLPFRGGWGRRCTGCGADHFPRVDPVAIMLAEYGGKVLLARQPQYPPRRYSALAGFIEPGESVEEAVAREIGEEAGIGVRNVRYVASQPWPFPGQLMMACVAEALSDDVTLDRTELEDAFWASRDDVRAALAGDPDARFLAPPPFAIAHTLLRWWVDRDHGSATFSGDQG
ncbi:NAD(+) diphosphatase [Sphingosinicella sp. BN140058]|uniref:NAD(+) diphosphatase n=1 Tax=Sphingosinicella sp. BN140058 TaxID=1892855 RepID=UPI001011A010|nr:NAD(+) diphosphatase [Sphingosinicella sp. BN140058]QAY76238.1 NAD(+) diphosphatase [Sphingosinicella sp. BN140058]